MIGLATDVRRHFESPRWSSLNYFPSKKESVTKKALEAIRDDRIKFYITNTLELEEIEQTTNPTQTLLGYKDHMGMITDIVVFYLSLRIFRCEEILLKLAQYL